MRRPRRAGEEAGTLPRLRLLALGLMLALLAPPVGPGKAWAQASQADLAKVRVQRQSVQADLDRIIERYEKALAALEVTHAEVAKSQLRLASAEDELRRAQGALTKRANLSYRTGPVGLIQVLLSAEGFGDFLRRIELLERAAKADSASLVQATRARAAMAEAREELTQRRAQQQQLVSQLRTEARELGQKLSQVQALEARLLADLAERRRRAAEEQRRRRLAASVARRSSFNPGAFACPVDGPRSFRDSWGEPRSGGRRHQGVDIYATGGTPVAAVVDGVITRMQRSSLGGISLYLSGGDSTEYFYAHLDGYGPVSAGQQVRAGSHVAFVGSSGNASGGAPHLHFEIHPGGGAAINPYPTVRAACG